MTAESLIKDLDGLSDPSHAALAQRFFKTGKGQYGEGDIFIGLRVPQIRQVAASYKDMSLAQIEKVLKSPIHEHRLAALIIMINQAKKAKPELQRKLYELYLKRHQFINNWDLVDTSCKEIIGHYLFDKSRAPLYELAKSKDMWERRTAIVSTSYFIGKGQLDDTFAISELLIDDQHDLIHKAVGWMLREAGKKDEKALKRFLDKHAPVMPRTMLRYSLERLNPFDRQHYMLAKTIS